MSVSGMGYDRRKSRGIEIKYKASPTGKMFHRDDTRHRGVLGPVGSGKSSMCVMEIFLRAMAQEASPDGIRRTRWAVIRNCFDDQTEVLTESRGWVLFKDLLEGEPVAIMGNDGEFLFAEPTYYYKAPYSGEMVCYRGEGIDFCVTPDHKLYLSKVYGRRKEWLPYDFVKAHEVYGSHRKYRGIRVAESVGGDDSGFSEDWFEFFGYWYAEGSAFVTKEGARRVCLTTLADQDYVIDLLDRCDIGWRLNDGKNYMLRISDIPDSVFDMFVSAGKSFEKWVPLWVKDAPAGHLWAFIHGHEVGDGAHAATGVKVALTSSRRLADDLQEMATRAGGAANIRLSGPPPGHDYETSWHTNHQCYSVTYTKPLKYRPYLSKWGWSKKWYDGTVYCVEVPGHRLLVRRGGVTHFNSQTYNELVSTTIKTFREWFMEPLCVYRADKPLSARLRLPLSDGTRVDCEVIFLACDRKEDAGKFRSLEITGAWINEASEIREKEVMELIDVRCGRYPPRWEDIETGEKVGGATWHGLIADTNAPDDEHWWYELAEVERPDNWKFFYQPPAVLLAPGSTPQRPVYVPNEGQSPEYPAAENVENISAGWQYYMDQTVGKPYEHIKVFLMAQYGTISYGKAVYPTYNDQVHFALNRLDGEGNAKDVAVHGGLPLLLGWDFGVQFSACVIAQLSLRGQLRLVKEFIGVDMGIRQFADNVVSPYLKNNYMGMRIHSWGDPAGASRSATDEKTCIQILNECGIPTKPCHTNSPVARQEAVRYFLAKMIDGEPGLLVGSGCETIRKGFQGRYCFKKSSVSFGETYTGEVLKNEFSHPHDAVQYIAVSIMNEQGIREIGANRLEMQNRYPGVHMPQEHSSFHSSLDMRGYF